MAPSVTPAARLAPQLAHNLLVNPGFEIWQRGAGPFTTSGAFAADEWAIAGTGGTVTKETTEIHNGTSSLKMVTTANTTGVHQGVEDYKSLEGRWVSFSVWVKTTSASVKVFLGDYNGSAEYATMAYHSGSDDWELLTCVKKIRTGLTAYAQWPHSFGIAGGITQDDAVTTYYIDGASLVVGEYRDGVDFFPLNPAEDMQRCERFYQISNIYHAMNTQNNLDSGAMRMTSPWNTAMYAAPTVTGSWTTTTNVNTGLGFPQLGAWTTALSLAARSLVAGTVDVRGTVAAEVT